MPRRRPRQELSKPFTLTGFRSGCPDIPLPFSHVAVRHIVGRSKSLHVRKCYARQVDLRGLLHASLPARAGLNLFGFHTAPHHRRIAIVGSKGKSGEKFPGSPEKSAAGRVTQGLGRRQYSAPPGATEACAMTCQGCCTREQIRLLPRGRCAILLVWTTTTPLPFPVPAGWLEALDESDAQLAAGQTVPLELLLDGLRQAAAQLEAKLAALPERTAARHRC